MYKGGNIERATDWVFNHPEVSSSVSADSSASNVKDMTHTYQIEVAVSSSSSYVPYFDPYLMQMNNSAV
jgi:hypothetical protein